MVRRSLFPLVSLFNRFRWRLALPFAFLFLAAMGGLGVYLSNYIERTYLADLQSKLHSQANLLADQLEETFSTPEPGLDLDARARHWSSFEGMRVTIISIDGRVVGESSEDNALLENHLNRPEIQAALLSGSGSAIRYSQTLNIQMMYVAVPIHVNDKTNGFVRVALPLTQVQANVEHIRQAIVQTTIGVTILTVVLALWIAGRISAPLQELTAAARKLAGGQLSPVKIVNGSSEMNELAQVFNDMATQIDGHIAALNAESDKLSTVLRQMTDGVMLIDADHNVRLMNPAAERMFDVKEADALGCPASGVLQYYQFVELWKECSRTGQAQSAAVDLRRPKLSLQVVATPLGESMPGAILMVFQDITQIRQLEIIRRDFLSNISHELRSPLASLKALTDTLRDGAIDDPPAAHHFLDSMETELDALTHLVTELLELARIESGQVPLQLKPVSPEKLVASAAERMRLQADRAGLTLLLECDSSLPEVLADEPRLEQVLVNLLQNAIKFTPAGGLVTLSASRQKDEVILSVRDTVIGISRENLPRIFERFFKADKSRSKGGTGLGLAIARHLVEAHGGRIWVESVEGQGSTFFLTLRLA